MSKTIGVISLGCDKNRVDTERAISIIKKAGYDLSNDISICDVVLINTCAFLESARREAVEEVFKVREEIKDSAKIIMSGCLPQIMINDIYDEFDGEVDGFLGINDYDALPEVIEEICLDKRVNFVNTCSEILEKDRIVTTPSNYAYLKIADGCQNVCSYCLIPFIRGRYKSTKMEDLVLECKSLGETQELILVAQDVTNYGVDLYGKKSLVPLLKEISKLDNIKSIRLLYCYPDKIDDELIEEIKL